LGLWRYLHGSGDNTPLSDNIFITLGFILISILVWWLGRGSGDTFRFLANEGDNGCIQANPLSFFNKQDWIIKKVGLEVLWVKCFVIILRFISLCLVQ
jgi:hypothetical protein